MSESEDSPKTDKKRAWEPTIEDFRAHISRVAPDYSCEVCSSDRFHIISASSRLSYAWVMKESLEGQQAVFAFLPVVCSNCGNIKLFQRDAVRAAIRQLEAQPNNEA